MASFIYNSAKMLILLGQLDLAGAALKVALVTSAYLPDIDAHDFFADVSGEVTGSGYTAGGKLLQNKALNIDVDNDQVVFTADSLSWTVATFTTRGAVIYKNAGSPAASPLIAYIDFEEDLEAAGEDFVLQWHEDGLLTLAD